MLGNLLNGKISYKFRGLENSIQKSIVTIMGMKKLKWLGHIERMDDQSMAKQLLHRQYDKGKKKNLAPEVKIHGPNKELYEKI